MPRATARGQASLQGETIVRPTFSELSYAFALMQEFHAVMRARGLQVPVFPSLQEEASLGYDVRADLVGFSFFLQFKRSDYMWSRMASEYGEFGSPYYRFAVYRRSESNQHNDLWQLAQTEPYVYYVAPCFHRHDELNDRYLTSTVLPSSAAINPSWWPRILDDDRHCVGFQDGGGVIRAELFSEGQGRREAPRLSEALSRAADELERGEHQGAGIGLASLAAKMKAIIIERENWPPPRGYAARSRWRLAPRPGQELVLPEYDSEDLKQTARAIEIMARMHFHAEWVYAAAARQGDEHAERDRKPAK